MIDARNVEFILSRLLLVLGLPEDTRLLDLGPRMQALVWNEAASVQKAGWV
jgi:hypothetical protein